MSVQSTRRSNPVHGISCGRAQRERILGQAGSPDPVLSALVAVIAAQIAEHCGHRLLKCRRLAMGWTVAQAVKATHDFVEQECLTSVGLTVRSWKDWEAGQPPNPDYQDLLCHLFTTNPVELGFARDYSPAPPQHNSPHWNTVRGDITLSEGGADHAGMGPQTMEVEETKRRDALKFAGLALTAPAAAAQILQQAATEAMEFTRQAEASALGSGTLDHLDLAVTEFNHAYSLKPPQQVFGAVLDYRRKVDGLLKGKHTHPQGRELLAFAGWLSELLAWLAHDLGDAHTGLAFANDAFIHAQQAGHGQLCAWAMDAAASINLYEQQPGKALAAARKGLAEAPVDHPLTVRLHAQAARAAAAAGDTAGFTADFQAAEDAYRLLPPRSPRRFGMDVLPLADYALTSYPATSFIWLGQAEQARRHAEHALSVYESAPETSRSPSREAIARIDLALAHAQLGDPDDAVALGHQALDSTRIVGSVLGRAGDLTSFLARRYPRQAAVEGLRERLAATGAAARPVARP
ncbi:tetratricopeptide repeat protein [Streptosporangium sp. NBC_01810]|uniref:tetratricopeptide repeat protein n=1 Tax=Streptosporangium sp. NBC_01810 TaxID=2975951 RepID=UPI002DDB584B|nr:tetratricopeptide repeat protein [Streptosporangium sp. NBC_01810]WSA28217.1 tetratricopeptide repeat protein [Streptosporangium sp. NBC_01810]